VALFDSQKEKRPVSIAQSLCIKGNYVPSHFGGFEFGLIRMSKGCFQKQASSGVCGSWPAELDSRAEMPMKATYEEHEKLSLEGWS
jgi:hypothetical protein